MNKKIFLIATAIALYISACDQKEDPKPDEFGYLSLSVALQIEATPAARTEAVDPSGFLVTIHEAGSGNEFLRFATYGVVPSEIPLPTGQYFVRATNIEFPEDAAFEQPWYFGESAVFTIDKEEFKEVDVTCTLANCKISFTYTQNVIDNFDAWNATATIDDGFETGASLFWDQTNTMEGYFTTDLPIDITTSLIYDKVFEVGESIIRTFNGRIETPQPATHYNVIVDAVLQDGEIMINIVVDDTFTTQIIDLGD